jgi:hypothetical protein
MYKEGVAFTGRLSSAVWCASWKPRARVCACRPGTLPRYVRSSRALHDPATDDALARRWALSGAF